MPIPSLPGALRRLSVLALMLSTAPAALAQLPAGAVVQPLPQANDPAELLAQALRTLATEPRDLTALMAAGHNALVLGDPNAAVGFFGRAQEINPRDGRVKAGLGSALVQLEKPQEALRLFAEASRLGVPDADLAEDRGLAYDLTGDPTRAQRDYQTVLAAHPEDDTVRRRLALSQGISGNKAGAIATLDPLIRKRDIAAWRAQTFVLAMNGDAKGANDITRIMLPQQAATLQPFLVRLSRLSPADKARAVHFGEMPTSGHAYTPTEVASSGPPATYAPVVPQAAAPRSDLAPPPQTSVATQRPAIGSPSSSSTVAAAQPSVVQRAPQAPAQAPAVQSTPSPQRTVTASPPATSPAPSTSAPTQLAQATPSHTEAAGPPAPALPTPAPVGHYDLPHDTAARAPSRPARTPATAMKTVGTPVVHGKAGVPTKAGEDDSASASSSGTKRKSPARADTDTADKSSTKTTKDRGAKASKLADADEENTGTTARHKGRKAADDEDVSTKSARADEDCTPPSRSKTKTSKGRKASTACKKLAAADDESDSGTKATKGHTKHTTASDDSDDSSKSKSKHGKGKASDEKDAADSRSSKSKSSAASGKAGAERIYVQVAGGANKDDMDKAWAGVKKKAPELMKGHKPLTTPLRATNRLLVGPFKNEDEAQAFVNKMAGKGLSGFTFKSSKGQKVEKVDTGG